ncbi:MAG: VOC family protein [Christensenellaceae bacterium]|jgi:hypothetical protein|nr:VOC family protein [Christensenellaceae bacterium]
MNNAELAAHNKNRRITQVCYVTDDYTRTIQYLYHALQFGPWKILSLSSGNTSNVRLEGKPVEEPFAFAVALCYIGAMQLEVVQPLHGPTVYERFLKERGPGIHHIKESMPRGQVEAFMQKAAVQGHREAFHGDGFQGEEDVDGFWYIDTYAQLGAYYELGNSPAVHLAADQYTMWPQE